MWLRGGAKGQLDDLLAVDCLGLPLLHSEMSRGIVQMGGGLSVMDWKKTAHSERTDGLADVTRELIVMLENSIERLRDTQNDASVELQQQLQASKLALLNALVEHY